MGGICSTSSTVAYDGHLTVFKRNFIEAAATGNINEIAYLISKGEDVDVCDRSGRTALHLASAEGHLDVVKLLIASGCSLNIKDRWGNEPLGDVILNGHCELKNVLEKAGATLSTDMKYELETKLIKYIRNDNFQAVKNLVECGTSLSAADSFGKSPLHVAVERGNLQIVDYLLKKKVDVNRKDADGRTSLDIATENKNQEIIEILLSAGALCTSEKWKSTKRATFAIMEACAQPIATALIEGREVEPLVRSMASLFYSDIVGFTLLSSTLSAEKVSRMLNGLFGRLDQLAYLHGVQKVDVVGDAYIAATNFTEDQPDDHAARLARFAIDAVAAAQAVPVDADDPDRHGCLQVRVGLHCGPVVGIVADRASLKYTLIGETAVTAARMESSGAAGRIQCSAAAARLIAQQADELMLRRRSAAASPNFLSLISRSPSQMKSAALQFSFLSIGPSSAFIRPALFAHSAGRVCCLHSSDRLPPTHAARRAGMARHSRTIHDILAGSYTIDPRCPMRLISDCVLSKRPWVAGTTPQSRPRPPAPAPRPRLASPASG